MVSAQANIAEMTDSEMRGELVRTDDIRRTIFSAARSVRNSVQTISDRISMPIAGMSDQHDIHTLIDGEIMHVLGDMDKAWNLLLPEESDDRDTDNPS